MPTPVSSTDSGSLRPPSSIDPGKSKITHDDDGNRSDGRESYSAFVKRARASNYTIETALSEFTDNSIEQGGKKIKITYDGVKICHIDNGIGIADIKKSSTIGVNRTRGDNGDGHYGKGFKEGAVSLANNMDVYTCFETKYMYGKWDVTHQKINDNPFPESTSSNKSTFSTHSQFLTGTAFEFSSLTLLGKSYDKKNLYKEYKKRYKYKFSNGDVEEITIDDLTLNKEKYTNSSEYDETISIYNVYQHNLTQKIIVEDEKKDKDIEANVVKKKNGNFMACKHVPKENKKEFTKLDSITWTTRSYKYIPTGLELDDMNYPGGKVDIRRKNLVTSSISFRNERGDNYCSLVEHELYYTNSSFDKIIGSNSNKQHAGSCPVKELDSILSWIQTTHETPIVRRRKDITKSEKKAKTKAKAAKKTSSGSNKSTTSSESGSEEVEEAKTAKKTSSGLNKSTTSSESGSEEVVEAAEELIEVAEELIEVEEDPLQEKCIMGGGTERDTEQANVTDVDRRDIDETTSELPTVGAAQAMTADSTKNSEEQWQELTKTPVSGYTRTNHIEVKWSKVLDELNSIDYEGKINSRLVFDLISFLKVEEEKNISESQETT